MKKLIKKLVKILWFYKDFLINFYESLVSIHNIHTHSLSLSLFLLRSNILYLLNIILCTHILIHILSYIKI